MEALRKALEAPGVEFINEYGDETNPMEIVANLKLRTVSGPPQPSFVKGCIMIV